MWERQGQEVQVALYVRQLYELEGGTATGALQTLLQRRMDDLGLTIAGLEHNRWAITDDVAPPAPPRRSAGSSAKSRLAVLEGGNRETA